MGEEIYSFFKIGIWLLYTAVSVSAEQQSESAICIHISPLFWISFPFRSPQSTEQSSLDYTVRSHQLSIFYTKVLVTQLFLFVTPWTILPTRLLHAWYFPDSTGMGCHFLLQVVYVSAHKSVPICQLTPIPFPALASGICSLCLYINFT